MPGDRARVLAAALGSIALLVAGALALDWFELRVPAARVGLGLRSISVCDARGACASVDMTYVTGLYPTFATITLWATLGFCALVALQAGLRLIGGAAQPALTSPGYAAGVAAAGLAVATAYLFGPELGAGASPLGAVTVERTWVPLAVIAGDLLGIAALYWATQHDASDDAAPYRPLPAARAPARPAAAVAAEAPELARGKLAYAVATAELSRAGIDARLEDGAARLVLWRDVVGAVARRLPPMYEGAPFVDLVSTAGATVRVLPWSRLTGEPLAGADAPGADADAARLRALLRLVLAHCPGAHLDAGTRDFLELGAAAPQLPDAALLAEHDARLA